MAIQSGSEGAEMCTSRDKGTAEVYNCMREDGVVMQPVVEAD